MALAARVHARRVLAGFMGSAQQATAVQERVLLEKVRRNAASDYGRDHGFGGIRGYDDFAARVPVTTYEDLSPYIERVRAGQLGAMFGGRQRVHMFAMTSGTTDQPKYVPITAAFLAEYRCGWNAFGVKALMDHPDALLRPIVQITSPMDEQRAPSGVPCGAITGLMAATQKRIVRRYYVTPPSVGYIADAAARYYTVARLALAGDVGFMITANPATLLRIARAGDQHAEQIICDVRDGTLDPQFDIPASVRSDLAGRLRPDPQRARYLDSVADRTGRLLPKDVWRLGFLANWTGGTMGLYLQHYPEYFGQTPVRDIGLLASEGRMSIPIEDGTATGILEVTANFYEFIPAAEADRRDPPTLRSHEVEVGGEYFILLTTSAGFYRYNIGDQVRVVGFHGQAPIIEFMNKGRHISSLTGEKLTEQQALHGFERACRTLGLAADLFVLAPQWADPPFYRLHVPQTLLPARVAPDQLAAEMDRQLRALNIEYAGKRDTGRLGRVQVNPLPAAFLPDLEARTLATRRGRYEQYKHRYLYPQPGDDAGFPVYAPQPAPQPTR